MFSSINNVNMNNYLPNSHEVQLLVRLRNIHLAYSAYIDQAGNPALIDEKTTKQLFPNEEKCEFDTVVYDVIDKTKTIKNDSLPKFRLSKRRQEEADRNNPDPENCEPVRLMGIEELLSRFKDQFKKSDSINVSLQTLENHITRLRETNISNSMRFQALKNENIRLYNKSLQVLRKIEVLRSFRVKFQPSEYRHKEKLIELSNKIQELNQVIQREVATNNRDSYTKIIEEEDDNETLSKENIENFCYALNQQRIGLEALTDIIKKDCRDISVIIREMNLV